jgi:hypothetical protein
MSKQGNLGGGKTSLSRSNSNASCAFTILNKTNKQSNDMFLSFQGHIQGTKFWWCALMVFSLLKTQNLKLDELNPKSYTSKNLGF